MRQRALALLCALTALVASARAWQADRGDGTFANPPLYADYPDPDIIRVGRDFYFATSTFAGSPGLRILHSEDLVNWEIVAHVVDRLDGRKEYDLQGGHAYRAGVFAPSLRYREGVFYLAVTPVGQHTRIYHARDIRGPWSYHELDRGAFDPALFLEADGTAWLITSGAWDGTGTLLQLDHELTRVIGERKIFFIKGAEGSKVVKRGDWYYLFNSIPSKLALTVSRAKSLLGPWETRPQIDDRIGGHQGAIVDLPDGSWYGFVMRDAGAIGRVTNLSPIFWDDDWPVWGRPDAPMQVPAIALKPIPGGPLRQPATSDEFDALTLGLQWAWNHNPDDARWSLTERPGFLRLRPAPAEGFWTARNTLTQKAQGPWCRGEISIDLRQLQGGAVCGFGTLGKYSGYLAAARREDGRVVLSMQLRNDGVGEETRAQSPPLAADTVELRTDLDFVRSVGVCSYRLADGAWTALGGEFPLAFDWRTGTFQGEQFALFCYGDPRPGSRIDVASFHFTDRPDAPRS